MVSIEIPKKQKFLKLWVSFRLSKKRFLRQEMRIEKIIFDYDVVETSRTPYGAHPGEVISRARSLARMPSRFGGDKAHVHTGRPMLHILDLK